MDKEEISSNGRGDDKPGAKPSETPQSNGNQSRPRAKRRRKSRITPQLKSLITFITAITPIIVAWLSYQASLPKPTPTVIIPSTPIPSSTPFFADTSIVFTDTPSPTILPSLTSTIPTTVVPSETITLLPQPKLIVLLTTNKSTGNTPLKVKMDARESYLTAYDGQKYVCRNGPCSYTWKIYFNDQQVGKADNSGGTFDYTFGKRGTYKVTVWVCRGRDKVDCGGGGIQITAT